MVQQRMSQNGQKLWSELWLGMEKLMVGYNAFLYKWHQYAHRNPIKIILFALTHTHTHTHTVRTLNRRCVCISVYVFTTKIVAFRDLQSHLTNTHRSCGWHKRTKAHKQTIAKKKADKNGHNIPIPSQHRNIIIPLSPFLAIFVACSLANRQLYYLCICLDLIGFENIAVFNIFPFMTREKCVFIRMSSLFGQCTM